MRNNWLKKRFPLIALLGSASTLICCAIPALLVSLGLGATFAGFVSAFPQITWLSEHKTMLFVTSGFLLLSSISMQWFTRNAPCPIDPDLAFECDSSRRQAKWITGISCLFYLVGIFFAFIAPAFFQ